MKTKKIKSFIKLTITGLYDFTVRIINFIAVIIAMGIVFLLYALFIGVFIKLVLRIVL